MTRRRIQPKPSVELETVSLRLPGELVRAVDQYAKYLGGSTDRTYVIAQAIEITLAQDPDFRKALAGEGRQRGAGCCSHRHVTMATRLQPRVGAGGTRPVPPASPRNTAVFTFTPAATHVRSLSPLQP